MTSANHGVADRDAERARWRAVHLAGDRNEPIVLHEPIRPFWVPDWELGRDHWRHRRPMLLLAIWVIAIAGCGAAWAAIHWMMGRIG